jgi:Integrase core domain
MSKEILVNELHRSARKKFQRRRVIMKGLNDTWQIDLVEMIPYARENKGNKYLLTVIDTFSKFAYAVPVKTKTGLDVTNAMKKVFKLANDHPKNIHSDLGKEFYNKHFKKLMEQHKINFYSTFTAMKASICERWNRTLKNKMWRKFNMQGTHNWIQILPKLVQDYNNTRHSTIKMKPNQVNKSNEKLLLKTVYNRIKIFKTGKFKVGDFVRISKYKSIFAKGYEPNWTTEIFKISKVQITNPVTYLLQDYRGDGIAGGFYEFELQKVHSPNAYLVEKIIQRRGNQVYVKWLGFDSGHNSWINKKDLL